jgi:predicted RNase H-like HicB family nuclease
MLTDYIKAAMHSAKYKMLDDNSYFGEIPALTGVWANAATLEQCRISADLLAEILRQDGIGWDTWEAL